jgi:voltage-gated potassium channel
VGRPHRELSDAPPAHAGRLRSRLHEVIFEHHTRAGRLFDLILLVAISLSVLAVMLESVAEIRAEHGPLLLRIEWVFTILFTIEYVLRLASVRRPTRYARSFYGVVDLVSIIPTYLTLLPLPADAHALLLVRALRLLRVFRILKLSRYVGEAGDLSRALAASRAKILVFVWAVLLVVMLVGTVMHLVEGPEHGFTSIPQSIYWAIVTMTTVGYGDIAPQTVLGQAIASVLMITGYGIIAVPTGIVSSEMAAIRRPRLMMDGRACPGCTREDHLPEALFCHRCGERLGPRPETQSSELAAPPPAAAPPSPESR